MPIVLRPSGDTDLANATLTTETGLPQTLSSLPAGDYEVGRISWGPSGTVAAPADVTAPTLLSVSESGGVVTMTFSEDVVFGAGSFRLYNVTAGQSFETFTASGGASGAGGTLSTPVGAVVTMTPGNTLTPGSVYALRYEAAAVADTAGNPILAESGDTHTFTASAAPTGYTPAFVAAGAAGNHVTVTGAPLVAAGADISLAVTFTHAAAGGVLFEMRRDAWDWKALIGTNADGGGFVFMRADADNTALATLVIGDGTLVDGTEYTLAMTYAAATGAVAAELNGVAQSPSGTAGTASALNNSNIFARGQNGAGSEPFGGSIAAVALWDSVITLADCHDGTDPLDFTDIPGAVVAHKGPAATFAANLGSGADGVVTGTLTDI